jgi:hypothetical protein
MTGRSAVAKMAKLVAAELAGGRPGDASHQALEAIGHSPELAANLLALVIKEGGKKRPDDSVLSACGFLLGHALEQVRYAVDRKSPDGLALASELRRALSTAAACGQVSPPIMLLVLHLFAAAKLDMGDGLRDLMQRMMEADTDSRNMVELGAWGDHLAATVEELEGDAFAIHGFLDETVTAMPEAMRAPFIAATFAETEPALREASIGFLCSEWSSLRFATAELIEEAAPHGHVSPTMLRRMIGLRNWLPAEQRPALDRAIKACRQAGIACASWPKAASGRILSTGFDGSGTHSVLVILTEGRTYAVAAMLGKLGAGVRDAWVRRGLSKAELDEIEQRFAVEAFLTPTTLDYAAMAARSLLAMNVATATMPPFGLLEFAEAIGLSDLNPEAMPTERLLQLLIADVSPEQLAPESIAAILADSASWPKRHPMLESWFDDSEEVRRLLAKRGSTSKKTAELLAGPLESGRSTWAKLLAWSALAMRHKGKGAEWQSFAIVGRELLGGRLLGEIGLMHAIADATVMVHRGAGTG